MGVGARVTVWGVPAGVFVAALTAYVYRLCPVIGRSDIAEFAVLPGFLAPGHYPGYPLVNQVFYLAHLFFADPAYVTGVFNAAFAAAAAAVLYAAWRVMGVRWWVAAPLALAFALTPAAWSSAAAGPEAFGVEALAGAILLYLAFAAIARRDHRYVLAAVLVFALSLGNRISFAMFAPVLVVAFLFVGRKGFLVAAGIFLLGGSVYLHYVLRYDVFGDLCGQTGLTNAARVYQELINISRYDFFTSGVKTGEGLSKDVGSQIIFQMKYGLLALVAAGVAAFAFGRKKWLAVAGALAIAAGGFLWAYVAYYGLPDEPYLILPVALFITFAARGGEAVAAALSRRRPVLIVFGAALFALPVYSALKHREWADHSNYRAYDCFTRETYKSMPYEASILAEHHILMPAVYYRSILSRRPDNGVYSIQPYWWEEAPAWLRAGTLPYFDEMGASRPRRAHERPAYFINEWPGIDFRPGLRRVSVPGEFLARAVGALPPGGRFCAVIGDVVPFTVARRVNIWGWQTYYWRQKGTDFPLERRTGTSVFLTGRRKKNGVGVYAAAKWGACAGEFVCPDKLAPPPTSVIGFGCDGDATRGLDALRLEVGKDLYSTSGSGIIFVPLTRDWRPAGEPLYYSHDISGPFYIFEILSPWSPGEAK
jgi:hypothetical protein